MSPEKAAIKRSTLQARKAVVLLDRAGREALMRAYRVAAADIRAQMEAAAGPAGAVRLEQLQQVLRQVEGRLAGLAREGQDILNEGLQKAARYGAAGVSGGLEAGITSSAAMRVADEAVRFVQRFVAADGLQLSDRIWRVDRSARDAVVNAIERGVIQGQGAAEASRDFLLRGVAVPADVAAKASAAQAGVIAREVATALTSADGAMANAMRLFRTEINRAHGEAYMAGGEDKPYFGGWKFELSPAHPEHDICDLLAEQNLYGLGSGVYPSREKCPWPAHPNTLSFVTMVFADEITAEDRAGKEKPMEALARLPAEVRRGVLGKGKAEVFDAGRLRQGMIRAPLRAVRRRIGG